MPLQKDIMHELRRTLVNFIDSSDYQSLLSAVALVDLCSLKPQSDSPLWEIINYFHSETDMQVDVKEEDKAPRGFSRQEVSDYIYFEFVRILNLKIKTLRGLDKAQKKEMRAVVFCASEYANIFFAIQDSYPYLKSLEEKINGKKTGIRYFQAAILANRTQIDKLTKDHVALRKRIGAWSDARQKSLISCALLAAVSAGGIAWVEETQQAFDTKIAIEILGPVFTLLPLGLSWVATTKTSEDGVLLRRLEGDITRCRKKITSLEKQIADCRQEILKVEQEKNALRDNIKLLELRLSTKKEALVKVIKENFDIKPQTGTETEQGRSNFFFIAQRAKTSGRPADYTVVDMLSRGGGAAFG